MGHTDSMDQMYRKHSQMIYAFLLSKCGDGMLAEELTQETFYQAVKSIGRYDGSCSVSTWLCAIAKHQLSAWRRKNPQTESLEEDEARGTHRTLTERESSGEEILLGKEGRVDLMRRLHFCPEPVREVLYLRIFGNLSFREIGEIMGKTENWARVTFYRGKERLRKELTEYE